jgi:alpha-glucosidase
MSGWWRDAVVYEIYVRSFADSDGDGVGDLPGIRSRLSHVADLGVDAVWLTPFYPSPMHDHGYDVADYCNVEPTFGTLEDFDALLADAHRLGLRVYVDVVPNHTSSEHPWFREALADPHSAKRDWYVFRPPAADGGPPNDWNSVFGGPAWDLDPASGEYYLHLFDASQPDLDWRNPEVRTAFHGILRFWLDRGVDGFRIDVAHALLKDAALRSGDTHAWDQDDVFEIWQDWRRLIDGYADRAFVGEVFLYDMDRVAQYVGADRLHQAFNFSVAKATFDATAFRRTLSGALDLFVRPDTSPTWVLSNHDIVRHPTRYGGGADGVRRARAATALLLALPGAAYLYQGEELGLEESDVPPAARQDPAWRRTGTMSRDGCRTPMPWASEPVGHGFTTGTPWLPFDDQARTRAVDAESVDATSTLSFYRAALDARRRLRPALEDDVTWADAPDDCLVLSRPCGDGRLVVATNFGDEPRLLGLDGDGVLELASGDGVTLDAGVVTLPGASTAWVRVG